MASKTSFYNNSGVTNEQSNAIDASVSNAAASETAAANSATSASNSASSASASATTATASKDAAVVAKDAAVVAKNAAEAAAGGVSGALAISNNLSDLANASTARTNLGVAIGSNVQAYSSVLQSTTAAYTSALNTKLSGIEANATADQTKSDIDALGINATQVSGFTVGKSVPSNAVFTDTNTTYSVGDGGLTQNNFTNADHTKLDGIEASADVTDTANVVAALTAGTNITIAANGTIASTASGGTSYTHPNHSGEVTSTGDGATVIASNVVDADNLKVTGNGSNTQFLRSDGDGTFTWATPVDTNTTYSIGDGGLTTNDFTNADHSKLNAIEAGATADQTNAEIRAAVEAASDSNVFTDADHTKLNGIATGATAYTNANAVSAVTASDLDMGGNKVLFGNMYSALSDLPSASTYHGMFAHVHATGKGYYAHNGSWVSLANASDIVTYTVQDGQLSQNNFTNADHSKLDAIESNATADQTASEIRTLVESATDSNVFTDADHTKLNAIEASADVTDTANVVAALTAGTNVSIAANGTISSTDTNTTYSIGDGGLTTNDFTNADHTKLDGIAASANNYSHPNHSGEVTSTADGATVIADNVVDEANLKVSNTPTDGYMLTAQSGNAGGLTWAAAASGGGGADLFAENYDGTSTVPTVTGTNSVAIGVGATATGSNSFSAGLNADASGNYGVSLGLNSEASGTQSVALGRDSYATATNSASLSSYSRASGMDSAALAITSLSASYGSIGRYSIAIGKLAKASAENSIAIGNTAISTTANQIALGGATNTVKISNTYTLPTSDGTANQVLTTDGSGAVTFATPASGGGGADLYAANESSPTAQPSATGTNSIAIGDSAISTNTNSFALGKSRSIGISSFAANIGNSTTGYGARNNSSIAIGYLASAGTASVCIGYNSTAGGSNSYTIGRNSSGSSYSDTYSFGNDIFASANNQVNIAGAGQDVRISERYTLPKVDGSANEVLTTDGSGAVSWAAAGGGGVTGFTSADNTSSPNNTVNVASLTASSSSVNAGIAIVPKGQGGIMFAIPDGTATGGNVRGEYAIDLSTRRTSADQVASGYLSVALGSNNKCSGTRAISIGRDTEVTAADSFAIGNGAKSDSYYGFSLQSSTTQSGALYANQLGQGTQAKGRGTTALNFGRTQTDQTITWGNEKILYSNDVFGTLWGTTTDGSAHTISPNGLDQTVSLANNITAGSMDTSSYNRVTTIRGTLHAVDTTNDKAVAFDFSRSFKDIDNSNAVAIGSLTNTILATDTGLTGLSFSIELESTTSRKIIFTVTGLASTNIQWVAHYNAVYSGY